MSPLVTSEIVAGMLVLLAVSILAFIFIRRRLLAASSLLMLCGLRAHGAKSTGSGSCGSRGPPRVVHPGGPLDAPPGVWERARLEPEAPGKAHEVISGMPDAVEVTCHYGTDVFQLALSLAAYTAMRSWLESAPPGFNVNVA